MVAFFKAIITGQNVDACITNPLISPVWLVLCVLSSMQFYLTQRFMCPPPQSRNSLVFSLQEFSHRSFMPTSASPSASLSTLPLTLEITNLLSTSKMLSLKKTLCKHNYTACTFWAWIFFSPKIIPWRVLQLVADTNSMFVFIDGTSPRYGRSGLLNHSPVEEYLSCFHFYTITGKTAMNNHVQVFE